MSLLRPTFARTPLAGLSRSLHSSAVQRQAPAPQATMPVSQALARTEVPRTSAEWAAAYPRHPLLAFFHTAPVRLESSHPLHPSNAPGAPRNASKAATDVQLPAVLSMADLEKERASRSWATPELRTKSSFELHQLWYLCLVERNVLATSFEELRWTGARALARMNNSSLGFRNRKVSLLPIRRASDAADAVTPHVRAYRSPLMRTVLKRRLVICHFVPCPAPGPFADHALPALAHSCARRWRASSSC
jgi:hypothetical protein